MRMHLLGIAALACAIMAPAKTSPERPKYMDISVFRSGLKSTPTGIIQNVGGTRSVQSTHVSVRRAKLDEWETEAPQFIDVLARNMPRNDNRHPDRRRRRPR